MTKTILAAAALLGLVPQAATPDVVKLKSGVDVKCKITRLAAGSVTYTDAAGKAVTAKSEEVNDVLLGDAPPSLAKANQAISESKFDKAFNLFEEALKEVSGGKSRDLHRQYVYFQWAQGLNVKGDSKPALAKLEQLRRECGDCRLRPVSYQWGLELARKKEPALVEGLLNEMKSEPDPLGGEAGLELAKLKYEKGDYSGAAADFGRLGASATASYAPMARLWQMRCLRGDKKFDELDAAAARVMGDKAGSSPALLQCAAATVAESLLRKAGADKAKIRDAMLAAAQAVAVGPPGGKDEAEDYAIALVVSARCCRLLSDGTEKAETKQDYKARAINYCKEVTSFYRGTRWAAEAEKELVTLGAAGEKPKGAGEPGKVAPPPGKSSN